MKKEQTVGARLPRQVVRELELIQSVDQSDRSTTVRKLLTRAIADWKLEHYARLYGDGKITLARAARSAGVSIWVMMEYLRARKIAAQYELGDLEADIKFLKSERREARP